MNGLGSMFLTMATSSASEPATSRDQSVNRADAWKFCPVCMEQMPHIRKFDYYECPVCQNRIYDKASVPAGQDEDPG